MSPAPLPRAVAGRGEVLATTTISPSVAPGASPDSIPDNNYLPLHEANAFPQVSPSGPKPAAATSTPKGKAVSPVGPAKSASPPPAPGPSSPPKPGTTKAPSPPKKTVYKTVTAANGSQTVVPFGVDPPSKGISTGVIIAVSIIGGLVFAFIGYRVWLLYKRRRDNGRSMPAPPPPRPMSMYGKALVSNSTAGGGTGSSKGGPPGFEYAGLTTSDDEQLSPPVMTMDGPSTRTVSWASFDSKGQGSSSSLPQAAGGTHSRGLSSTTSEETSALPGLPYHHRLSPTDPFIDQAQSNSNPGLHVHPNPPSSSQFEAQIPRASLDNFNTTRLSGPPSSSSLSTPNSLRKKPSVRLRGGGGSGSGSGGGEASADFNTGASDSASSHDAHPRAFPNPGYISEEGALIQDNNTTTTTTTPYQPSSTLRSTNSLSNNARSKAQSRNSVYSTTAARRSAYGDPSSNSAMNSSGAAAMPRGAPHLPHVRANVEIVLPTPLAPEVYYRQEREREHERERLEVESRGRERERTRESRSSVDRGGEGEGGREQRMTAEPGAAALPDTTLDAHRHVFGPESNVPARPEVVPGTQVAK